MSAPIVYPFAGCCEHRAGMHGGRGCFASGCPCKRRSKTPAAVIIPGMDVLLAFCRAESGEAGRFFTIDCDPHGEYPIFEIGVFLGEGFTHPEVEAALGPLAGGDRWLHVTGFTIPDAVRATVAKLDGVVRRTP